MPSAHHANFPKVIDLVISLCLTYTLLVSGIRIWIRRGMFGVDDIITAVATFFALGHNAADYVALAVGGLGKPLQTVEKNGHLRSLNAASISGMVVAVVALYLTKCSCLAFLARITRAPSQVRLYHICNAALAVTGVVSLLIVTVGCDFSSGYYWAFHSNGTTCPHQSRKWEVFTAMDVLTEILLLALQFQLVCSLQMSKRRKCLVMTAFALRAPTIGMSLARSIYTCRLSLPHTHVAHTSSMVVIWIEIQIAYALLVSTLSASKHLAESFNSGFGQGFARGYSVDAAAGGGPNTSPSPGSSSTPTSNAGPLSRKVSMIYAAAAAVVAKPERPTLENDPLEMYADSVAAGSIGLHPALRECRTDTHVSAIPLSSVGADAAAFPGSRPKEANCIVRETAYEVRRHSVPAMHA